MCGIYGMIAKNPHAFGFVNKARRMASFLQHRGPDGNGEFLGESVLLGMCRLSIIDLEGGWQPLYNEDRSLVLVANGEIYNFVELRNELKAKGHRFSTGSDCETILHLYEEYGENCVEYLRGMFAFALWDIREKKLLLARDRMGEKPLYIFEKDGAICFASELKALRGSGLVPFELDANAINLYFHYKYIPDPFTAVKGVRKLPPANVFTINLDPWSKEQHCYWRMEDAPALTGDPGELIREELKSISKLIIRSDVPVGVALSGGLDSSVIAALAVSDYPDTVHAFSIGYPGNHDCDERQDAKAFAEYLGMPFHDMEITTDMVVGSFEHLVLAQDDPIADISSINYFAVMKLARDKGVPVMLQGQGGDELFWGYPWVRQAMEASLAKQTYQGDWKSLLRFMKPTLPSSFNKIGMRQWIKSVAGMRDGWKMLSLCINGHSDQMVFYDMVPFFQYANKHSADLFTPEFTGRINHSGPFDVFTIPQPWEQIDVNITRLICQTYLLENGIANGDRLSMASSVELRLPLVDYRLVETVIGLRKSYQDFHDKPKAWFKSAVSGMVPDWVLNRPKRGFTPPVREWQRALFHKYGDILAEGYLVQSGILQRQSAIKLAQQSRLWGEATPLSFAALVLEIWCQQQLNL